MGFCAGLVGPRESQPTSSPIPSPSQCVTVGFYASKLIPIEHPHNVVSISSFTNISVVPSVVTTIIFTPAPTATLTATVPVNEYLVEEISTMTVTTQTVTGLLTHTVAPTCIPSIQRADGKLQSHHFPLTSGPFIILQHFSRLNNPPISSLDTTSGMKIVVNLLPLQRTVVDGQIVHTISLALLC
jgi:hypothetical protein